MNASTRWQEAHSRLRQASQKAGAERILVNTWVYVSSVKIAIDMIKDLSTSEGISVMNKTVGEAMSAQIGAPVFVMELQNLLYADSNLGTSAQYIPATTTPPPAIFCQPYQAPNHSTVTHDGDDLGSVQKINVGMSFKIMCNTRAKIMGNGSNFVVCQRDGTYSSLGRWCQECEAGKIVNTDVCLACDTGKFNNGISVTCNDCPENTYANTFGQTACTACPVGTVTMNSWKGAKSMQECSCIEGSAGISADCQTCPVGKYSVRPGLSVCTQCAENRSTPAMGASSKESCLCVPGLSLNVTSCAFPLFCLRLSLAFLCASLTMSK